MNMSCNKDTNDNKYTILADNSIKINKDWRQVARLDEIEQIGRELSKVYFHTLP